MNAITSWPNGYVRITRSFCYPNSKHHIWCSRIKKNLINDSSRNADLVAFQISNVSFAQDKRIQILQGQRSTLLRRVGIADKSMTNWVVLRLLCVFHARWRWIGARNILLKFLTEGQVLPEFGT